MRATFGVLPVSLVLLMLGSAPLQAQEGYILARATEAATARPLPTVQVGITGGGVETGGQTNQNGQVRVAVRPGTYTVSFVIVGYATETVEGVTVRDGQTSDVGAAMESNVFALDEMVISAGRQLQKKVDAPATMATVGERTIDERPVATPVQHLYSAPGVDIIKQGVQSANVVVRGFNNIFSGALHTLTDNRIAGIPSLRVNLIHFIPTNDDDLARMEVVLGPGSALYGPNTANGVLHLITKSPLTSQRTRIAVAGGERSFFKGLFRSSHLLDEEGTFGIKVSGQYVRANDWEFVDPAEVEARGRIPFIEAGLRAQGVPEDAIALAVSRVGVRDYQIQRWGGEVRADWRVNDEATWVFQAGATSADGIELTGIGAGQTDDWLYSYYQTRFNWNRLFAQVYVNASDAGDSYLVRQGAPLVDNSKMYVGQVQHGFSLGEAMANGQARQDFTYGVDVFLTRPQTEGRINGQYEDDDNIDEVGGYLQSQTALTDQFDLIGALRVDDSSVLDHLVWSPRAALVFKPDENQSFRFTFNRAFSTPTTLNYFLDINAGLAQGLESLGFFTRAQGPGRDGYSFQNDDGSLRGMRSPFNPDGGGALLPGTPEAAWQMALNLLLAQGAISAPQYQQLGMIPMQGVGLNLLNPVDRSVVPLAGTTIPDTPPLEESTTQTFEVGYQGVLQERVSLSADVWYSKRDNFTSPLVVRTPLLLLDGEDLAARLLGAGVPAPQVQALVTGAGIPGFPGLAATPVGVVSSDDVQTGTADIVASYVNFGEVDMWGWDMAFRAFLNDQWTLDGTASWVSDDFFIVDQETDKEVEDFDRVEDVNEVLGLNAPDFKGSVTLGYRNDRFTGEGRFRYTSEFPVNSADFVGLACLPGLSEGDVIRGCIESASIFDLLLGYRFPDLGAELQLNVQNLFDTGYRSFVGVPEIGRFLMIQMKYEL
ncbi:MAG: TonB-dependent receptor [Gemmatimonadota bacterium]|jgi:iron complex outermembrane receptor protein